MRGVLRRRPGIDFSSEPLDCDDVTVLGIAAHSGRIVVSHDVSTMPEAFRRFRATAHSPGVLLTPQNWPVANAIEQLFLMWELTDAAEWRDRICYLPTLSDFRSRR